MTDRDPFVSVRALLFVMPLAILVGSVLAPPDPFTQLGLIAVAVVLGWPFARRVEAEHDVGPRTLGLFYLVVAVAVLVGFWVLSVAPLLGVFALVVRLAVVVLAIAVAYRFVLSRSAR